MVSSVLSIRYEERRKGPLLAVRPSVSEGKCHETFFSSSQFPLYLPYACCTKSSQAETDGFLFSSVRLRSMPTFINGPS